MPGPAKKFTGTLRIRIKPELLAAAEAAVGKRKLSEWIRTKLEELVDAGPAGELVAADVEKVTGRRG